MARWALAAVVGVLLLGGALALAGQARSYSKPIEVTWDEAVKAVRDAELSCCRLQPVRALVRHADQAQRRP